MALRRRAAILLFFLMDPGFAQIQQQSLPSLSYASPGDAATGEIVSEDGNQLRLNVRPCDKNQVVVVFRKPYVKDAAGTRQCNGATKSLFQVLQQP